MKPATNPASSIGTTTFDGASEGVFKDGIGWTIDRAADLGMGATAAARTSSTIFMLLSVALVALGVWLFLRDKPAPEPTATTTPPAIQQSATDGTDAAQAPAGPAPDPIEPLAGTPVLEASAPYAPHDNVLEVDISEYAGYGGLIVANGGLAPNPASIFAREHGFQVKLSVSETETWSRLNNGDLAATALPLVQAAAGSGG